VKIIWDEKKNDLLIQTRGISFDEVSELIIEKQYYAILEHPSRRNQMLFIIPYKGYTYVVPFVVDKENNIVLKTIFPSRKFHKIYSEDKR
jgi:uncharacterized DUF497 family protein